MTEEKKGEGSRVIIRAYPNTVYLWPTAALGFLIYLIDYIFNYFLQERIFNVATEAGRNNAALVASIWFFILFFNLIVMSFDLNLGKTFTLLIIAILLGLLYIFIIDKIVIPEDFRINLLLVNLNLVASANFYIVISLLLLFLFIVIYISNQYNYWEISPNRIRHHNGIFEREENFSALNSRVVTKTDDIFERLLFRAGTIHIIDPDKQVHVLRNVYKAVGKDKQIQKILSVMFTQDTKL